MTRERLSDHNVVGILSGMDAAREAIVALGRAGVEADKVSLLGRLAEEAAAAPDTPRARPQSGQACRQGGRPRSRRRWRARRDWGSRRRRHGLAGSGNRSGGRGRHLGRVGGHTVGAFVGGVASVDLSEDWELTYQSVHDGNVLVAVHGDSEDEARQASEVVAAAGAEFTRRFDASGRLVS